MDYKYLVNLCKVNEKTDTKRLSSIYDIMREHNIQLKPHSQKGGNIHTINYEGKKYLIRIENGMFIDTEDNEIVVTFFSLNNDTKCATLFINKDTKEAIIQDISGKSDCMLTEDLKKTIKIGHKFVKLLIKLAKQHDMKQITLHDASKYYCKPDVWVDLLIARTLTHGYPFYEKYGFVPVLERDQKVMDNNNKKLENVLCKDVNWKQLFKDPFVKKHSLPEIERLVNENGEFGLKEICSLLMSEYCEFFSEAADVIYQMLGLRNYRTRGFILLL